MRLFGNKPYQTHISIRSCWSYGGQNVYHETKRTWWGLQVGYSVLSTCSSSSGLGRFRKLSLWPVAGSHKDWLLASFYRVLANKIDIPFQQGNISHMHSVSVYLSLPLSALFSPFLTSLNNSHSMPDIFFSTFFTPFPRPHSLPFRSLPPFLTLLFFMLASPPFLAVLPPSFLSSDSASFTLTQHGQSRPSVPGLGPWGVKGGRRRMVGMEKTERER